MQEKLVVCWQDPHSRQWHSVGLLEHRQGEYKFRYTQVAAEQSKHNFTPFVGLYDLYVEYSSPALFPVFKNRLLPKNRPEFNRYLDWLGLTGKDISPIQELARSSGLRATDNLQLFPYPENNKGYYSIHFFIHGVNYMNDAAIDRAKSLQTGDKLKLLYDLQNETDQQAILLRTTTEPPELIGYCPSFLCPEFKALAEHHKGNPNAIDISVVKANPDAPLQNLLLCEFSCRWPDGFNVFESQHFELIPVKTTKSNTASDIDSLNTGGFNFSGLLA